MKMQRNTRFLMAVCLLASAGFAGVVDAAPCQIATGGTCPASNVCVTVIPATTREPAEGETVGAPYTAAEHASYEFKLSGTIVASQPGATFNYPVAAGKTVALGAPWSVVDIDLGGLRSKPFACTQPVAVAGPKLPPGVPAGLETGMAK